MKRQTCTKLAQNLPYSMFMGGQTFPFNIHDRANLHQTFPSNMANFPFQYGKLSLSGRHTFHTIPTLGKLARDGG